MTILNPRTMDSSTSTPKRNYLSLAQAVKQLGDGYGPGDLLDMGLSGELHIYAPILAEGKYVWPVTDRGIAHSRVIGRADSIFETRFKRGDYMILPSQDIQHIRENMDVIPNGFIAPEATLHLIEDWEAKRKTEYIEVGADKSAYRSARGIRKPAQWYLSGQRMRKLAKHVPWELADSWVTHPDNPRHISRDTFIVRIDMLRVAESAIQSLQPNSVATTAPRPISVTPNKEEHATDYDASSPIPENNSGLMTLEKQIRAIEATADAQGMIRKDIPRGKKKALKKLCEENYSDLFTTGDTRFETAWKAASKADRVIIRNRRGYRFEKVEKKITTFSS